MLAKRFEMHPRLVRGAILWVVGENRLRTAGIGKVFSGINMRSHSASTFFLFVFLLSI